MKNILILAFILLSLILVNSCSKNNKGTPPTKTKDTADDTTPPNKTTDTAAPTDTTADDTTETVVISAEGTEERAAAQEYTITCKCKKINYTVNAKSTISEKNAKLMAGKTCLALEPEKENLLKKEEKKRIQAIMEKAIKKVLSGLSTNTEGIVLKLIYDCKSD